MACIYCPRTDPQTTEEHVVSAGLGCTEVIHCVCKDCNDRFGHSFEAELLKGFGFLRTLFRIPDREGKIPSFSCTANIGGAPSPLTLHGDGTIEIPPKAATVVGHPIHRKIYTVFRAGQEKTIERNIRKRHADLEFNPAPNPGRTTVEVPVAFDDTFLSSPPAGRAVAKFAINLLAHQFGERFVQGRFGQLIRFVNEGAYVGTVPAGIVWHEQILQLVQAPPPMHIMMLAAEPHNKRIVTIVLLFSLFPFCVIADDPEVRVELFRSLKVDPHNGGRLEPLITTRPFPELPLAELVSSLERGTQRQAIAATNNFLLLRWAGEESLEYLSRDQLLCRACGRLIDMSLSVCPHCGKAPSP